MRWPSRQMNPSLDLRDESFLIISKSIGQATDTRQRPVQPERFKCDTSGSSLSRLRTVRPWKRK